MILGEPVGDRLNFFSEGNRGCLPNYHLCVSYERGKHDYVTSLHRLGRLFLAQQTLPGARWAAFSRAG